MEPAAPEAPAEAAPTAPYDALLVVSFGGPEKPDDVIPFLENVTRGRNIPRERLADVGAHYALFGGRSPINDQCRAVVEALRADLAAQGLDLPVYWGNRNWDPYLTDTLAQMREDGVGRAVAWVTSAYSSYSGCRQYRENLWDSSVAVGAGVPQVDRVRHYFNHPGFTAPFVESTAAALDSLAEERPDDVDATRVVFVTHSIPTTMNDASGRHEGDVRGAGDAEDGGAYVRQHLDVAGTVAAGVAAARGVAPAWDLVYCSRSGPPSVPWLEPDVNDHLEQLAADGTRSVVVVPIGFVSDHMEVIYDLDTEAEETAGRLGLGFRRAATPGTDPRFVAMIRDLVLERAAVERGADVERPTTGDLAACWERCPAGCCLGRAERPALLADDSPDLATAIAAGATG